MPSHVLLLACCRYFAAAEVEDCWCVYPWDADDVYAHTATAEASRPRLPYTSHSKPQDNGCCAAADVGASSKQNAAGVTDGHAGNCVHAANGAECSLACNGSGI